MPFDTDSSADTTQHTDTAIDTATDTAIDTATDTASEPSQSKASASETQTATTTTTADTTSQNDADAGTPTATATATTTGTDSTPRPTHALSRRALLAAGVAGLAAGAGCLGGDDDDPDSSTDTPPGEDPAPDDTDDDSTDPDPPSPDPSLLNLAVGSIRGPVEFVAGTGQPVTVTLANQGDDRGVLTVDLVVTPVSDAASGNSTGTEDDDAGTADAPVVSASRSQRLAPGEQHRFTFDRLTEELPGGQYTVTATAGTDTLTQSVTVVATTDVTVDVYTTAAADEHRATDGTVSLVANYDAGFTETVATADIDGAPSATLSVPVGVNEPTDYIIKVTDVNGGAYPGATRDITIAGPDDTQLEFVTGYEFQGADSLRFSDYVLHMPEDAEQARDTAQSFMYGTYARNGDYHVYSTGGPANRGDATFFRPDPYFDMQAPMYESSPLEYGADLKQFQPPPSKGGLGYGAPSHSLFHDGEFFQFRGMWQFWQYSPVESALGRYTTVDLIALDGLDAVTTPEEREFVGTRSIRGAEADIFEINTTIEDYTHSGTRVYTDPETGHVVRVEVNTLDTDNLNTLENEEGGFWVISEFSNHGEPETVDWDLIKSRSTAETGHGTSEEYLDQPPWE